MDHEQPGCARRQIRDVGPEDMDQVGRREYQAVGELAPCGAL